MNDFIKRGTVLNDRYQVESLIGSGGMGHVFKAVHLMLDRPVAVKTLNAQFAFDDLALKRFYQEAKIAGTLGNDNICEVIDIGTHNDTPYLVMPLLTGKSLRALVDGEGRLDSARAVDICAQILCALSVTHKNGIVHRDLKPDNIFITSVGDRKDFVKLLDFGICKIVDPERRLSLTGSGMAAGTPQYMSPEQVEGTRAIDQRVDIYGAGCLLYFMLTGKRPFGTDMIDALRNIMAGAFPMPRDLNPNISRSLEQVVMTAMARDPNKRYGTAEMMRTALLTAAGMPISKPDDDRTTVADKEIVTDDFRPTRDLKRPDDLDVAVATVSVPATPRRQRRWFAASVSGILLAAAAASILFIVQHQHDEPRSAAVPVPAATLPITKSAVPDAPPAEMPATLKIPSESKAPANRASTADKPASNAQSSSPAGAGSVPLSHDTDTAMKKSAPVDTPTNPVVEKTQPPDAEGKQE